MAGVWRLPPGKSGRKDVDPWDSWDNGKFTKLQPREMNICNIAIKGKQSLDVSICSCDDDVFSTGCSFPECIHNKTQEEGTIFGAKAKFA